MNLPVKRTYQTVDTNMYTDYITNPPHHTIPTYTQIKTSHDVFLIDDIIPASSIEEALPHTGQQQPLFGAFNSILGAAFK